MALPARFDAAALGRLEWGSTCPPPPKPAVETRMRFLAFALIFATAAIGIAAESDITYERDIRPILKTHCFHCHGEGDELAGGLDVRLRRWIVKGGESGAAVVPGKSGESLLLERLLAADMPPEEVESRPTDAEVQLIEAWITDGAKTARKEPETISEAYVTEEERSFWAFQPVLRQPLPAVDRADRVRTPIDQFLLAKLESKGLSFSPEAGKVTLLRRAHFDLLGLPPLPADVGRFLSDQSPDAYERLIDRLLASPRYGERWGRHWLDVAGYADSEGYTDADAVRPESYKYRDYVVRSFNSDRPYDQFLLQQLAGDELVDRPWQDLSPEQKDALIATGFLRMAPDGTGAGGVDQSVARNDVVAKTIEIVSTSVLGLTVGCAQCHNHRYDPISQQDYYSFRALFEPAYDWKNWLTPAKRRVSLYSDADREKAARIEAQAKAIEAERTKKQQQYIDATFQRELAKLPENLREPIRKAQATSEKSRTAEQKKLLKEHPSVNVTAGSLYLYDRKAADELKKMADNAAKVRATKPTEEFLRALWEPAGKTPPATFVFYRGDHEQPKQQVAAGELAVLTPATAEIPENDPSRATTGRRLAYARSLTSGKHPLTARVIVNRIWMHHLGRGIVGTPGDFGFLGTRPTHPELLDWLADEFVRRGWSIKALHRLIMTSTVYRQSSHRNAMQDEMDADNLLLGRMPVRRLEAEAVRDATIAVSGKLYLKSFGPAVPVMADRVGQFVIGKENLNAGRPGAVIPMHGEEFRRSIYIQVRRSRPLGVLDTFDVPRMEPNCTSRASSTVAPQSLLLMNSDFVTAHAQHFADRVVREAPSDPTGQEVAAQIRYAWQLAFAAEPAIEDVTEAERFIRQQIEHFQKSGDKSHDPNQQALASFCHALLSSNSFLYVD